MSAATLAMLSPESKSAAKSSSKTLRINEPGDAYEREADKVADTVAGGGRISHWSLSSSGAGLIQRDPNTAAAIPTQPPIRMIGDPKGSRINKLHKCVVIEGAQSSSNRRGRLLVSG